MSLSLRDRCTVLLQPHAVTMSRTSRVRGRAAVVGTWRCEEAPASELWKSAVDTLAATAVPAARAAELSVVLSNRFCHFALIDVPKEIAGEAETHAYLLNRLQGVHGDAVKGARIASSGAGARARFACCVPAALLDAVRGVCDVGRVASIQPYLTASWNLCRKALRGDSGWFVVQESGRVTAVLAREGTWLRVASRRCGGTLSEALDLLDRERELAPEHHRERTVWMHAPVPDALSGSHRDYAISAIRPRINLCPLHEEASHALAA